MKIELTPSQERELKEKAKEKARAEVRKENTFKYLLIQGLNIMGMIIFIGLIFFLLNKFMTLDLDGYSSVDNFDSCWIEEDVMGINKNTGEVAELHKHFNCSDFVIE